MMHDERIAKFVRTFMDIDLTPYNLVYRLGKAGTVAPELL